MDVPGWPGHKAGQHVEVRLTAEDGYRAQRSYSIANAPEEPGVAITVERLDDGEVSPYLAEVVRAGDQLELRGPIGGWFTWEARARRAAPARRRRLGPRPAHGHAPPPARGRQRRPGPAPALRAAARGRPLRPRARRAGGDRHAHVHPRRAAGLDRRDAARGPGAARAGRLAGRRRAARSTSAARPASSTRSPTSSSTSATPPSASARSASAPPADPRRHVGAPGGRWRAEFDVDPEYRGQRRTRGRDEVEFDAPSRERQRRPGGRELRGGSRRALGTDADREPDRRPRADVNRATSAPTFDRHDIEDNVELGRGGRRRPAPPPVRRGFTVLRRR